VLVVYLISPRGVKRDRLNGLGSRIVPFGQNTQDQRPSRFRSDLMCQEIAGGNSPTIHLTARRSRKHSHPAWQFRKEALFTIVGSYLPPKGWLRSD